MSWIKAFVILILVFMFGAKSASAGSYFGNLYRTEKRGVTNIVSGFAEFPLAFHEAYGEGSTPIEFIQAGWKGAVQAILRTASGIWDIPAGVTPGMQRGFPPEPETLI
ncbi:MAG: hypothetical protein HY587_00055 [Candidatus Omnitrophica bacterium]|nr:hypothetical protein [Candidatus Omnitrophota bacterium]